ncbi:hypothetical protein [Hyphobacterium sp.]|jgi:hypothetical protein|uniref:hypothetical protein n=1 Tax=Hyphobacterium sp. TaxID=2004662 RepID=UPI003BA91412
MKFVEKIRTARQRRIKRLRATIGAGLLAITGILLTVTPVPFGAPVFASGVAMLSAADRRVRRTVMGLRERYSLLNISLRTLAARLPHQSQKLLRLTDPGTYRKHLRDLTQGKSAPDK